MSEDCPQPIVKPKKKSGPKPISEAERVIRKEARRIKKKAYKLANKERISAANKEYYQEHKEERALYAKEHAKQMSPEQKAAIRERQNFLRRQKGGESEAAKNYRERNKERLAIARKKHYKENREKILQKKRERRRLGGEKRPKKGTPEHAELLKREAQRRKDNPEAVKRRSRKWYDNLSLEEKAEVFAKILARAKARRKNDPCFRALECCRSSIHKILGKGIGGSNENGRFFKYLGCQPPEFKAYIESKFRDGMTWENRGSVWHMDHIVPISLGKGNKDLLLRLSHYRNLQPLLVSENLKKSDSLPTVWPEGVPSTREELGLDQTASPD